MTGEIFCCPVCHGDLIFNDEVIHCKDCGKNYEISNGIPLFFVPDEYEINGKKVTEAVRAFYENNPFPNYEGIEDSGSLIERARDGIFAKQLDDFIPAGARILEIGCGTGQLSNFLSLANRRVFGIDASLNSLNLAQEFKNKNHCENVSFIQMNLFRPAFKEETFDLIICNGVLHHTPDPYAGFRTLSRLVKNRGYVIIGLYHRYGRILTDIRRFVFKISGGRIVFLDARSNRLAGVKRDIWILDQYKNTHESKHMFKEVQGWFNSDGFRLVKTMPKVDIESNRMITFLSEVKMAFTGNRNGGIFMTVGQKKVDDNLEWVKCDLCGHDEVTPLFKSRNYFCNSPSSFQLVKCNKCGLVYVNPRPKKMINYYLPRNEAVKKDVLLFLCPDRTKILKNIKTKGRILDIGCGHGDFLRDMKEEGWEVYGNEISESGCNFARARYGLKNIYNNDLLALDFEKGFFDAVTMWHTIEHMKYPADILKKIHRILKDDGVLIIESPNFSSLQRKFFNAKWYALNLPCHLYHLTPKTYKKLLESAGFEIYKRDYIVNPRIGFISLKHSILRWLGLQKPPDAQMKKEPDIVENARRFEILWKAARLALNISCVALSFILSLINSDDCLRLYCRKAK